MSDTLFVTVADDRAGRKGGRYSETQDRVYKFFAGCPGFGIDRFAFWKWADIVATQFYRDNRAMLDHPDPDMNGRCYKPFAILEGLKSLKDGEFLIYNDISAEVWGPPIRVEFEIHDLGVIKRLCVENGGILSATGRYNTIYDHTHENFTLERCINKMGMSAHRYDLQHASGMLVFQRSQRALDFVEEWLTWNLDDECASLGPTKSTNLESVNPADTAAALNGYVKLQPSFDYWNAEVEAGFGKIGHRHDQSISGLLLNRLGNRLVIETDCYNFLNFCRKDRVYEFVESNQPPLPYRLKMRHGTMDGTDGVVDKIGR